MPEPKKCKKNSMCHKAELDKAIRRQTTNSNMSLKHWKKGHLYHLGFEGKSHLYKNLQAAQRLTFAGCGTRKTLNASPLQVAASLTFAGCGAKPHHHTRTFTPAAGAGAQEGALDSLTSASQASSLGAATWAYAVVPSMPALLDPSLRARPSSS